MYVVAAMLLGVYFAMQSGTFDAIVYDTVLEETGSSDRFESVVGRVRMAESVSLTLGALAGGALAAATAPRVTYFATLPFLVVSTMFLLRFREPRLHEAAERRSLGKHLAVTVRTVRCQSRLIPIAAAARPHRPAHPGRVRVRSAVARRRRRVGRVVRSGVGGADGVTRAQRPARRPGAVRALAVAGRRVGGVGRRRPDPRGRPQPGRRHRRSGGPRRAGDRHRHLPHPPAPRRHPVRHPVRSVLDRRRRQLDRVPAVLPRRSARSASAGVCTSPGR